VHPFWSSHEEKCACVRLSMGGQPWLELELHGRRHGDLPERGERGKEEGERGRGWGCGLGKGGGGHHGGLKERGLGPCWAALFSLLLRAEREEEEKEKEGKEKKRKEKIWKIF
jgi:hypothetical protein